MRFHPCSRLKVRSFPKDVILRAVFFHARYPVSYRDLEEIVPERGVRADDATLNRWFVSYASGLAVNA